MLIGLETARATVARTTTHLDNAAAESSLHAVAGAPQAGRAEPGRVRDFDLGG